MACRFRPPKCLTCRNRQQYEVSGSERHCRCLFETHQIPKHREFASFYTDALLRSFTRVSLQKGRREMPASDVFGVRRPWSTQTFCPGPGRRRRGGGKPERLGAGRGNKEAFGGWSRALKGYRWPAEPRPNASDDLGNWKRPRGARVTASLRIRKEEPRGKEKLRKGRSFSFSRGGLRRSQAASLCCARGC